MNQSRMTAPLRLNCSESGSESYITTDGQSASTHPGLKTRFLLLSDSCRFVDVGRSIWREGGSVVYNFYWCSPAQSLSGPSPVGLATIFYGLKFETSLFVVSYDSQGYGEGILSHLHTGFFFVVNCASMRGSLYRLPVTMRDVIFHGNVLTEPWLPMNFFVAAGTCVSQAVGFRSVLRILECI
jgi:hypothetical protein